MTRERETLSYVVLIELRDLRPGKYAVSFVDVEVEAYSVPDACISASLQANNLYDFPDYFWAGIAAVVPASRVEKLEAVKDTIRLCRLPLLAMAPPLPRVQGVA